MTKIEEEEEEDDRLIFWKSLAVAGAYCTVSMVRTAPTKLNGVKSRGVAHEVEKNEQEKNQQGVFGIARWYLPYVDVANYCQPLAHLRR